MKKILITLILIPYISFSQVVSSVDFHVVNDGMESDYLKLEQIWREFHEKNIEDGTMIRWTLFKVNENKRSCKWCFLCNSKYFSIRGGC